MVGIEKVAPEGSDPGTILFSVIASSSSTMVVRFICSEGVPDPLSWSQSQTKNGQPDRAACLTASGSCFKGSRHFVFPALPNGLQPSTVRTSCWQWPQVCLMLFDPLGDSILSMQTEQGWFNICIACEDELEPYRDHVSVITGKIS